jgi:hypothetical protein
VAKASKADENVGNIADIFDKNFFQCKYAFMSQNSDGFQGQIVTFKSENLYYIFAVYV